MVAPPVQIELENVGVAFPIYNTPDLSIRNYLTTSISSGRIDRDTHNKGLLVHGLQNINLKINSGERIGIVGPNGAGKTTMLRLISGIYAPTEGHAKINGSCVSLINISLGIDYEATGRDNIQLRLAMMGLLASVSKQHVDDIIDFSGLGEFIDLPFRTYSSGMRMRLVFAISTLVRPDILIMDEWLATGDLDFHDKAEKRLRAMVDETKILVLASHSEDLLRKNCTRLIWLENGQVKMDGPSDEVANAYFRKS